MLLFCVLVFEKPQRPPISNDYMFTFYQRLRLKFCIEFFRIYFNWFINGWRSFEHMLLLKHKMKIRRKTYCMNCTISSVFYINFVTFMYILMLKIIFRLCALCMFSLFIPKQKAKSFQNWNFSGRSDSMEKEKVPLTISFISYTRRHRYRCDKIAKFGQTN